MVAARDLYVSPAGDDDNPGSKAAPWKTVQKACESMRPGDTALVQPGTYKERIRVDVSGTKAGGYVTLKADGKVLLDGTGSTARDMIEIYDQSYVKVIGFEIAHSKNPRETSGVRVEGACDHIEIRNNIIHDLRGKNAMGITVYGTSPDEPISDLIIDGNEIYDCEPAKSEALTLNGNVTKFEVTNNKIRDVNNIGIDFIGGEKSIVKDTSKVVRDGICRGNHVSGARSNYGGGFAAGIYIDGARDIVVEGNTVTACDLGIEIGAENKGTVATGITVRKNAFYLNYKAGLAIGGYSKKAGRVEKCTIEDNIFYMNCREAKAAGEIWVQHASGNSITANSIYAGGEYPALASEHKESTNTIGRNTWFSDDGERAIVFIVRGRSYLGLAKLRASTNIGDGAQFRDPGFIAPKEGKFLPEIRRAEEL